jgi:hypothetical protein
MCPFCMLTAQVVFSGSISAGVLGAILIGIRKSRAAHQMNPAGCELKSPNRRESVQPSPGETTGSASRASRFASTGETQP